MWNDLSFNRLIVEGEFNRKVNDAEDLYTEACYVALGVIESLSADVVESRSYGVVTRSTIYRAFVSIRIINVATGEIVASIPFDGKIVSQEFTKGSLRIGDPYYKALKNAFGNVAASGELTDRIKRGVKNNPCFGGC